LHKVSSTGQQSSHLQIPQAANHCSICQASHLQPEAHVPLGLPHKDRLRLFTGKKRRLWGDLTAVSQYLKREAI